MHEVYRHDSYPGNSASQQTDSRDAVAVRFHGGRQQGAWSGVVRHRAAAAVRDRGAERLGLCARADGSAVARLARDIRRQAGIMAVDFQEWTGTPIGDSLARLLGPLA